MRGSAVRFVQPSGCTGMVLIGKVYGHLANERKKAMAEKLNFGSGVVERAG